MNDAQGNKRIAKNTLIIYINLFLSMLIGLATSRFLLQALGVDGLGLFNVVGGIVGLFTFIFGSLSVSTTRYINVEMGKPDGDVNKVFNVCNVLHIGMALLVLAIAEIGGIIYILHYLNAPGKEGDAMFIFQISIIVSCIGITNVPFSSLFNATEKFLFNAIVSISLKVFQLLLVIWLMHFEGNRIRAWSIGVSSTTFVTFAIYHIYCFKYWPETIRWRFVRDKKLYKEILSFNNYNLLSTMAIMGRSQGSSLLINYFHGPAVNGAFAIAKSVESHLLSFTSNFDVAAGPQITQNYSAGNLERVQYLAGKVGKYCLLLMLLAFFPLIAEMPLVLKIWLKNVPEGALEFSYMTMMVALAACSGGGIPQIINASGKVAVFKTTFSIMMLLCIPIGYVMFKIGIPPHWLMGMFALVDILWRVVQLLFMKKILHFPIMPYVKEAYLPPLGVAVCIIPIIILTSFIPWEGNWWHLGRFLLIGLLTGIFVFFIGLRKSERQRLIRTVLSKFQAKHDTVS